MRSNKRRTSKIVLEVELDGSCTVLADKNNPTALAIANMYVLAPRSLTALFDLEEAVTAALAVCGSEAPELRELYIKQQVALEVLAAALRTGLRPNGHIAACTCAECIRRS